MYKGHPFVYRSVEDNKKDIDTVKAMVDEIQDVSGKPGRGQTEPGVLRALLSIDPYLNENPCFSNVFSWLYYGGKTAFLQDANSMIMRPPEFIEVLTICARPCPA
jgi:hypothetical protein